MNSRATSGSVSLVVSVGFCAVLAFLLVFSTGGVAVGTTGETAVQTGASGFSVDDPSQVTPEQTDVQQFAVNSTSISAGIIGVVGSPGTVTVQATGITDGGGPVTGESVTFSIGNEVIATSTVNNGVATATANPTTLNLDAGQSLSVEVVEGTVANPATVEIAHETLALDEGFNLLSVPQAAAVVTEGVSAVNVWNSETQTYETVTNNVFDSPAQLQSGLYVSASHPDARLGLVFEDQPPAPGVGQIGPGWSFVGSNFAIDSLEDGGSRTLSTDIVNVDLSEVSVFDATLTTQLSPDAEIGSYEPYWVFAGSGTTLERPTVSPPYDPDARATVLGTEGPDTLTITNSAPSTVQAGGDISVTATVENAGITARNDVLVSFSVANTVIETQTVSVDGGTTETVTFTVDTGALSVTPGTTVSHTVAVPDDKDTATIDVEGGEPVDDVLLDSVSSLLNASGQPLVDDSITAIEAEPSATNSDEDGDGDAVSYPSDVDIPVMAVDDNVVGVTGPFVTTDTDFANFGNEEVMLNLYDELLGGSGTIVHDEGHGQFYTLAPNGGDDFQAFADYAENNGYTYTNTTDIQNATSTADAFVITTPSEAFTQSELDALSAFVDNGGVLFLHDQSDFNNFDATDNHNEIASAVDASFRFNDDQVIDTENNTGAQFVPTTGNFDTDRFTSLFSDREGLGLELDVNESYEVDVIDVADGDTVDVQFNNSEGTIDTVRINGLDTAETGSTDERLEEYEGIDNGTALRDRAAAASTYAQNQLANETVTLSFAPTEGLRGDFGRLLGFLELDDGSVYNEEVIRDGWARVYDSGFAQHDEYWELEQQARANGSGIWDISDPANTSEIRDDPVSELFFPQPVEVTGPETPVSSENGEPLVALDRNANVAALGGPLVEERYETAEGGPGIDQYEVFPFVTNVMEAVGNATGPVVVDAGHDQFASDYAVSAEDTAYYMRYLEGQSPGNESFIGLDGTVDLASEPGPDLVDNGSAAARAVIISTPNSELTPAERTAVADFADAGGAVILMGSSANTTALSNFDSLLSDLNTSVGFTGTNVTDATNNLAGNSLIPTTSNFSSGSPELFTAFTPAEAGAPFNVSSLTPASATVLEGEAFDVSATVTNEGTEGDNQTVELRLEPDTAPVRTQQVDLNASESTTVTFENVTVDQVGEYNHTVASLTDQATGSLTVEPLFDDVFLDSVSSLLNASGQPLTDDSITAIEAESTASNTDADGDGDAVSYPSDVDIPVAAVDGNVVGITGPFVTDDTDFGTYGNEEFLLNVYDRLLGGSGTILHDEGHGQFYDLSSFQTFAGFAESEGYTYDNTTDIQNATSTADAFVITTPSDAFSQSELDALSTFVDNGGVLFLHDQSDFNNFDATDNHNAIASALNASFRFNDDQVVDSTNNGGAPFLPVTGNFNEATFPGLFTEGSFNVSNLAPADATVSQGESFSVSATVTNEGDGTGELPVELRLEPDGSAVSTQTVRLAAGESTTVTFSDVTVDQVGEYNHTVASPGDSATGSLTVQLADVFLDSVSSLLNASGQPLVDDSITAIEAESTASNTDSDGDGDAVSYPSDVDIPVAAVDGNVVGITGPFVTDDTGFESFSNEEFLLNVYDKLLGGSGAILHDEGHGQFYDRDSVGTFADYAESNGYTYNSTTDIQNATGTADAFIITTPSDAFSQSELDALSTFVDNGGALFLHDQSDFNNFDATDNHNAIASAVNASFRFNDDQVTDSTNNGGAPFLPVTGNFNEAEFPGLFNERPGIGDGSLGESSSRTVAQLAFSSA